MELLPLLQQALNSQQVSIEGFRSRIHAIRLAKRENQSTEDRLIQDLTRTHFFRPKDVDLGSSAVAELCQLFHNKTLEKSIEQAAKAAASKGLKPKKNPLQDPQPDGGKTTDKTDKGKGKAGR